MEAYNARDIDELAEMYHPEARYWSAIGGWQEGVDSVRRHIEELHETLPDEQMETRIVVTNGDVAVAEFVSTGTAPDGRPYRIEFTEVFEIEDARIRTVRVYLDPTEVAAIIS